MSAPAFDFLMQLKRLRAHILELTSAAINSADDDANDARLADLRRVLAEGAGAVSVFLGDAYVELARAAAETAEGYANKADSNVRTWRAIIDAVNAGGISDALDAHDQAPRGFVTGFASKEV